MTIESTNDNNNTKPAITYSECYQQCFCSDNLELMKTIESNTIDLIYCDILYGTGRKFADYQDLKPIRSEIEAHYLPRLKEMHRVLKSTGSIYLQMDYRIVHWLRCIMDDVFGYNNFRNEIIWSYKRYTGICRNFQTMHDNILRYSKSENYTFHQLFQPYQPTTLKNHKWEYDEINGTYFYWKRGKNTHPYKIHANKNGVKMNDVWDIPQLSPISNERYDFTSQKPKALIERIIKASSNEGDLVADFYMGSGTTCEVALELGRRFIGCDINTRAIEITKERIKKYDKI